MKRSKKMPHFIIILMFIYLFLPLLISLVYSLSKEWTNTILPVGLTFEWYQKLFEDSRFIDSLIRTLLLSFGTMLSVLLILIPAVFAIVVYLPKLDRAFKFIIMMPFALPGVVSAVALIRTYGKTDLSMVIVLAGAYFVLVMPFMYQGIRNSLLAIHTRTLMDAAAILGASRFQAFRTIIIPAIIPGIFASSLLSFSVIFGEFVLANLLVGGYFETVQIYLYRRLSESGHISSAIVIVYFILLLVISFGMMYLTRKEKKKLT